MILNVLDNKKVKRPSRVTLFIHYYTSRCWWNF